MSISLEDLESFNEFVVERLRKGKTDLTLEQCLWQWRETRELLADVREAMEDIRAGRVYTHEEVKRELEELRRQMSDSVAQNEKT